MKIHRIIWSFLINGYPESLRTVAFKERNLLVKAIKMRKFSKAKKHILVLRRIHLEFKEYRKEINDSLNDEVLMFLT